MEKHSHVKSLSAQSLNYHLPDEKVALHPLAERDLSKLLVWKNGAITDANFRSMSDFLPKDSLLVFNNTKVIRARLHFQKSTGANIEIFCLDPCTPADYQQSFQQTESCIWYCMVGNLKKWKGENLTKEIQIKGETVCLEAEKLEKTETAVAIRFKWNNPKYDFATIIESAGTLPIPPYLHRETEESDIERYQTVYSKEKGSVAAPTAGLHFTQRMFQELKKKNISRAEITLHVGAGTFKPVQSETIGEHEMHAEQVMVSQSFIEQLLLNKGKIIAVGTTSIRSLESLYWLGFRLYQNPELTTKELNIQQWLPYECKGDLSVGEALNSVLNYMRKLKLDTLGFHTQIIIVPSYKFRIVEGMFTNFHQPQSTLLLLISAFIGEDWKRVYQHALDNNYRFLSYGDSNLYLR